MQVLKNSGELQPFSKEKLQKSIRHTCLSPHACASIAEEVTKTTSPSVTSNEIFSKTEGLIRGKSKLAAAQYSLKRALFDLGPEGHHFETFVARYFQEKGYETLECVTLQGLYVKHEIDVMAVKAKEKLYAECKFHNHLGIKNDIKIALYVKARWDDLRAGPDGKSLSGFCLISNTSFTSDALAYAKGTGLKLMGVNAPENRSFLDEIKALQLYPLTSLTTISKSFKRDALSKKIVLAKDLLHQKGILTQNGYSEEEIGKICEEICLLTKDSCENSVLGCH